MTAKKMIAALSAALLLGGCKCHNWQSDQKLRHDIFQQCIQTMQKQPEHNHEDDNGHLVEACEAAAYRQSLHDTESCP